MPWSLSKGQVATLATAAPQARLLTVIDQPPLYFVSPCILSELFVAFYMAIDADQALQPRTLSLILA